METKPYEPLVIQVAIPAELQQQVAWLKAHGAGTPKYGFEHASDASDALITTITWTGMSGAFYHSELPPFGATDQSITVALAELMARGLATGPIAVYSSAPEAALAPVPVDDIVGIPDPHFAGQFQPGPRANMLGAWNAYSSMGMTYLAKDGKRYHPVTISGGPMPAWNWMLV